jgi:hypothetical protein
VILNAFWKNVYVDYQKEYPYSSITKQTLKDWLHNTLKELKTINSDEEGLEITLQCDDMLEHFKTTNGHVLRNTLKRHQNMMDGVPSLGQ